MNRLNMAITAIVYSFVGAALVVSPARGVLAQQPASEKNLQSADQATDQVVATVGGKDIMLSQVQRRTKRLIADRKLSEAQRKVIKTLVLNHYVSRAIIFNALKLDSSVGEDQVRIEVDLFSAKLETVGQTLDEHLAQNARTRENFEEDIRWVIGWNAYVEQQLTEEKVQEFFESERKQFDGTEIKVAQILFPIEETSDSVEAAIALAKTVRGQLIAGEVTWQTALEKHSIAPSKENGGSVGWIGYHEPMPQKFSRAAFDLEIGQVSEPFATEFGVHLLKPLEIRPGTRDLGDAREEVEATLAKYLFTRVADQHRDTVTISYADGWQPSK